MHLPLACVKCQASTHRQQHPHLYPQHSLGEGLVAEQQESPSAVDFGFGPIQLLGLLVITEDMLQDL